MFCQQIFKYLLLTGIVVWGYTPCQLAAHEHEFHEETMKKHEVLLYDFEQEERSKLVDSISIASHRFNIVFMNYVQYPIHKAYTTVTPTLVRTLTSNFLDNIGSLSSSIAFLIEGNISDGAENALRFLVNSTIGFAGLLDPASDFQFEGKKKYLGASLYKMTGIGGTYIELPILGPSFTGDILGFYSGGVLSGEAEGLLYPEELDLGVVQFVNAMHSVGDVRSVYTVTSDDDKIRSQHDMVRSWYSQKWVHSVRDEDALAQSVPYIGID